MPFTVRRAGSLLADRLHHANSQWYLGIALCDDEHVQSHAHPAQDADDDPPSTGFLPMSLAVALFISGLFVLGVIPTCGG